MPYPRDKFLGRKPGSFEGRWMALLAVSKLFDNPNVANSVDLGK